MQVLPTHDAYTTFCVKTLKKIVPGSRTPVVSRTVKHQLGPAVWLHVITGQEVPESGFIPLRTC